MEKPEKKPKLLLPFDILPEGQHWKVGQSYRTKIVLRLTGIKERDAEFEVVDATSMESADQATRKWMTDGGYIKK